MRPARITLVDDKTGERTVINVADVTPLEDARAELIADVKAIAQEKILAILPEYMQRNLTARAAELAATFAGITPDNYPEPERSEWAAGKAKWDKIKAIRNASNLIEAEIAGLPTSAEVFAYAETIHTNPLWPE